MKSHHTARRILVVTALALVASVAFASTAFATAVVPDLPPLTVTAAGTPFTYTTPSNLVTVTASGFQADNALVIAWVDQIARQVDRAPVNATRKVWKRRLVFTAPVVGLDVDQWGAVALISTELVNEANNPPSNPVAPLVLPVTVTQPKVKGFARAIVVSIKERKLFLYNNMSLERSFRCAVGQPRYPSPPGAWKVIGKKKLPSWHNPHVAWSRGMPDVIGPGPRNPLGTRALYLNAPGIRIHGTSNIKSIGTPASHGCIRMLRKDIEWLYPKIPVGTPVWIVK
jgi:lipoprotein-anchoring transpeptidase ErfK/SrfK